MKAEYRDSLALFQFGSGDRCVVIVGGIHGNEVKGIEACQRMVGMFSQPTPLPLIEKLLQQLRVVIIPCINTIGALASARSCPKRGTDITFEQETGRIVIAADEKGGHKYPPGWADANRGWENNETLVKHHLQFIINAFRPTFFIWNHDWAAPQAIMKFYRGPEVCELDQIMSDGGSVFKKDYPTKTIWGKDWQFVLFAGDEEDKGNMPWMLAERFGIHSCVIEQYMDHQIAEKLHIAANLFVLEKLADANPQVVK